LRIEQFLEHSAQRAPEKLALVCGETRLTYAQVENACSRLAYGLRTLGVRRGDRVLIYLDNSVEAVLAVFAILRVGGVFVIINPSTKSEKLSFLLNDCRPRVLITHTRRRQIVDEISDRIPHVEAIAFVGQLPAATTHGAKQVVGFNSLMENDGVAAGPPLRTIDLDLAALVYTSGSTGEPKGAMLSHVNMVSASTSITTYLQNTPDDRIYSVLPLSFDYGLYQVLMAFQVGATVILDRSFTYPHTVLQKIVDEQVTGFPVVPTIAAILFQADLRQYELSSLRYITSTGAELQPDSIRQIRSLLPKVSLYSMYGLTECKRVSFLPPDEVDRRPTSVGKGMPNEEVWIVDEAGNRLGAGIGELVVRGSNVMEGYWEQPEETSKVLKPGPLPGQKILHTGDVFRADDEGYLYFVRRKDDIIKTRGEKVSPREVERVLCDLPGIAQAAVVGIPDPILGQAIKAVLTRSNGARVSELDVLRHAASRLEDLMVPTIVEFREALPLTSNGKVDKEGLRGSV
jgi:long-chain acyl-CoA synthetase